MIELDEVIKELQQERDRLDQAIATLSSLNESQSPKATMGTQRPKRQISAAGIARIRAAAKARWARVKAKQRQRK